MGGSHPWTRGIGLSPRSPPNFLPPLDVEMVDSIISKLLQLSFAESSPPVVHLDQDEDGSPRPALFIALAGWLLEYPFTYLPMNEVGIPEDGDSNFGERLDDVELDVFSCYAVPVSGQQR